MKKKGFMLGALALVMMVTGCGKQTESEQGETTRDFCRVGATAGVYTLSDNGFLWINLDNRLCYLDFSTGETVYLCNKEGCNHTTENCDAYVRDIGGTSAFFYDGSLYIVGSGYNEMSLWKADVDGTNRRAVIENVEANMPANMTLIGDKLYLTAYVCVEPEEGDHVTAMKEYYVLLEFDLKNEKSTVIASYEDNMNTIIDSMYSDGEKIYYITSTASEDVSEIFAQTNEDGTSFEDELYDIQKECELCSYDPKTGNTETLYEKSLPYLNVCSLYGVDSDMGCFMVTYDDGFFWIKDGTQTGTSIDEDNFQLLLSDKYIVFYDNLESIVNVYDKSTCEVVYTESVDGDTYSLLGTVENKLCFFSYGTGIKMDFFYIDVDEILTESSEAEE